MGGTLTRHAWRRLGCLENLRRTVIAQDTLNENHLVTFCFQSCSKKRQTEQSCENWSRDSCPFGVEEPKVNKGSLAELRDMILFLKLAYDTTEPSMMKEDLVSTLQKWVPLQTFYTLEKWFTDRDRESPFEISSAHRPASGFKEIIQQLLDRSEEAPFGDIQESPSKFSKKPESYKSPLNVGNATYLIFQGPPGTGKTREANLFAKKKVSRGVSILSENQINLAEANGKWTSEYRASAIRHLQKFMTVTQFHPSYSYEDFIEGLRPLKNKDGSIRYEIVDGVFMATWRKAAGINACVPALFERFDGEDGIFSIDQLFEYLYDFNELEPIRVKFKGKQWSELSKYNCDTHELTIPNIKADHAGLIFNTEVRIELQGEMWGQDNNFVLFVDEVNRGKVSKIFGELLFAMAADPNDNMPPVKTQYSKTMVTLPSNLHIVCTMNTCDKSVDILDQALKRRFQFVELMPLTAEDDSADWLELRNFFKSSLANDIAVLLDELNYRLLETNVVEYDRQIGHSFFFKARTISQLHSKNMVGLPEAQIKRMALAQVFLTDIFPILQEFFIDDRRSLVRILGSDILELNSVALNRIVRGAASKIVNSDDIVAAWEALSPFFDNIVDKLGTSEREKAG